jgi:CheY-like chemotaxis protein
MLMLDLVSLLMTAGRDHGARSPGADSQVSTDQAAGKRVAIVEDELMVAWSMETMLEDLGHDVVGIFANGEDALAGLHDELVDVICLDINLGGAMDGIEVAQRIRRAQPIAILFVSAYSDAAIKLRIAEAVPDALLLQKPTTPEMLKLSISEVAGRS